MCQNVMKNQRNLYRAHFACDHELCGDGEAVRSEVWNIDSSEAYLLSIGSLYEFNNC